MDNNVQLALSSEQIKDTLVSVTRHYQHLGADGKPISGKVTVHCDASGKPENRLWKARNHKEVIRALYWDELYDDAYEVWKNNKPEGVSAFKRSRRIAIAKANELDARERLAEQDLIQEVD